MNNRVLDFEQGIKIKKTDFFLALVVFSTFDISYLSFISLPIKLFYLACQSFFIAYGIMNIFAKKKYGVVEFLLIAFIAVEFYSTFSNHEALKELILNTKMLLLLYVSFKWAFGIKPRVYVYLAARYSLILMVLNTLSAIVCYPKGLFYYDSFAPAFVIGADNTSTRTYILSLVFCFIDYEFRRNNCKKHLLNIFTISLLNFIVFVFLRDIGNGKMCAIVFVLAYIVFEICKVPMIKQPMKKIIVGNYILFFIMVVFNRLDLFTFLIVNVLHRDLTLTTRTTIWKITVDKIIDKPFWGNGYMSGEQFESMLPSIIGINAHNSILMVAFIGGLVLSAIFLLILLTSTAKYDKRIRDSRLWMIPIAFLGMFLRSQVEGGDAVLLIAIVTLISSVANHYIQLNVYS